MSAAALLDELLSGFAPPAGGAWSDPTPAKTAKAANRKHPCGLASDFTPCEGLRKPANRGPADMTVATDSQEFAAVRNPSNGPESKQPCGFSQDSQGLPGPTTIGDDLAAVAWMDDDIARFFDRRARLLRWGWNEPEAENLAELLVIRDREADDRRMCLECAHLSRSAGWRCGQWKRAGIGGAAVAADLAQLLQRCDGFASMRISLVPAPRDNSGGWGLHRGLLPSLDAVQDDQLGVTHGTESDESDI